MAEDLQVRSLTINEEEHKLTTLYRLQQGWLLRFKLGPTLLAKTVRLFCNHPNRSEVGFLRHQFYELEWTSPSSGLHDVYDNYAQVRIICAGSFNYYFTTDGSDEKDQASGSGYFLVDPLLHVGEENETLSMDCIQCQSLLSKCLGPFQDWEPQLQVAKESGYNMIHFTPVQELGYSLSAYCIRDQLKLNPTFSGKEQTECTWDDIEKLSEKMAKQWKVLPATDLVLNHTSTDSPWIHEHPECGYNLVNSPHLRPAYLFDRILWRFSYEIGEGKWSGEGIPPEINSEKHLSTIERVLRDIVLPPHKLHEFYLIHNDRVEKQFKERVTALPPPTEGTPVPSEELFIVEDELYRRLQCTVDMELALKIYNIHRAEAKDEEHRVTICCEEFRHKLDSINHHRYHELYSHVQAAVGNVVANARWRFLTPDGPKIGRVSKTQPIMWTYFYHPVEEDAEIEEEERWMEIPEKACKRMAHNGWVMNDDPLRNFAEKGPAGAGNIYLRRELIVWGDNVKLRYGDKPEDCPYLWERMAMYTRLTAKYFHSIRLDNCHSTPINVAEYLLDEARKIRPDLYVVAELFTASEHTDNIFINRLGINSLVREALQAWDCHEQGRLVYRYGGLPVGAFLQPPETTPLEPSVAHAIFFDQTHDNPSPIEKRSVYDLFASSAVVSMACCATGSNRGYDELVPHHINVVEETRRYCAWTEGAAQPPAQVCLRSGIIAGKRALNHLHADLGAGGFSQIYVDQVDHDIVSVTRHNPDKHETVICVARTAFSKPHSLDTGFVPPLCVPGTVNCIVLEGYLKQKGNDNFKQDQTYINGLTNYSMFIRENVKLYESEVVELRDTADDMTELEFVNFPPGSAIVCSVSQSAATKSAVIAIRSCLTQLSYRVRTYSGRRLNRSDNSSLRSIVSQLSFADLNRVLYRVEAEERDDGRGGGVYDIPGYGPFIYCGLQGLISVLSEIRRKNDLGHPLCENLRTGDWMMDYISGRLLKYPPTRELGKWFEAAFGHLKLIPRYMIPCYFEAIVGGAYRIVCEVTCQRMGTFVAEGSSFVKSLALASLQFCGTLRTAPLPRLSPNLAAPLPPTYVNEDNGKREQFCVTISAGLPHFAHGIMRNWGRDTFIALRGLLLLTGRYQDARYIILSFAATLRHGLIPNLLGAGSHARYNCRDAVWFWLQCIQDYTKMVPEGHLILKDVVSRTYPTDDSQAQDPGFHDQPLYDVIQEALSRHYQGVWYRERFAGSKLDMHMVDAGFNTHIMVDTETGFPSGGNEHNCGTWMDKMGGSSKAGNKGKPATPRDGSPVELVGLCKSTLRWVVDVSRDGHYPYTHVKRTVEGKEETLSFKEWASLLDQNFERCFYINELPKPELEPEADLINRRDLPDCQQSASSPRYKRIYKDTYKATQKWADYQLRCNFPIAMVQAPEMFEPHHAWQALTVMQEALLGPLGMKTLDPRDWVYRGDYDNSNDSHDFYVAQGFNYHQGPEWVWPVGFFLRAKLYFARKLESERPGLVKETVNFIKSYLSTHLDMLQTSTWASLPELTNSDGKHCRDSCDAQAWSIACILEVLYDLQTLA